MVVAGWALVVLNVAAAALNIAVENYWLLPLNLFTGFMLFDGLRRHY